MPHSISLTINGITNTEICDSARFDHVDADRGLSTVSFRTYNDWIILDRLCDIVLYFRRHCIVEIGAGISTFFLAQKAARVGVKLYTCDIKSTKTVRLFGGHEFFEGTSEDFMKQFDDIPAVVLIDGNHDYKAAKTEFDFFYDKLIPGGIIFIHDTMPPCETLLSQQGCGDVYKLRQELETRKDLDCFTWPYTAGFTGLTMIMKKEKERPCWEQ